MRNVSRRSSFRRASNTNRSNRAREADQLNNHEITFSNGQNQNRQNIYHQNHNSNVSENRLLFIFSMNRVFRVNRFYEVSCFRKIDFYDLFEESGFSGRLFLRSTSFLEKSTIYDICEKSCLSGQSFLRSTSFFGKSTFYDFFEESSVSD